MNQFFKSILVGVFSLSLMSFLGCGGSADVGGVVSNLNKNNPQKLANCLSLYQSRKGKAAKSEEDFCDFIANDSTIDRNLDLMDVDRDSFKDYLISERDGEPFFIRYGVFVPARTSQPLVFETVGVDGSRQVGFSDAVVKDITDEKEYERLKSGKFKKKKPVNASGDATKEAAEAAKTDTK